MKKKAIIIIFSFIILLIIGLVFLGINIKNTKNKKAETKTEVTEKTVKVEVKENYNGILSYDKKIGLTSYVKDDKFNEVKKEIPKIQDILDDYLRFKHLNLLDNNYNINLKKITNVEKILYYSGPTGKIKCDSNTECKTYEEENVNIYLSDSVFGNKITKVAKKSDNYFKYDSKNKQFILKNQINYSNNGEYIRIIDLNKKDKNYILKIKIGTILSITKDQNNNNIYTIGGVKSIFDKETNKYKNTTTLNKNYKIEDESLLDTVEIELKPYNNSFKYVISNIKLLK